MKTRILGVAALLATSTSAFAVGLDRSGQTINPLFAEGGYAELSFAYTDPALSGRTQSTFPVPGVAGASIGDVADDYVIWSGAIKMDISEKLSFAVLVDEPFGSDIFYDEDPFTTSLGGTGATVDSYAVTALLRYKFNDNWSIYGGPRYQETSATVSLGGLSFASSSLNGFNASFAGDSGVGFVLGAAYEIPEIALRVSLTYSSEITHDFDTVETNVPVPVPGVGLVFTTLESTTDVDTPESLNLDFQTGIAADTLLFGTIRWARYSNTVVTTGGAGITLTDLEDGFDISVGVGRRFNEKWSGSITTGITTEGSDSLVSPLAPENGRWFVGIGAKYDVTESFAIAGGIRYTEIANAIAAPGGSTPVADFEDNEALSVGLRFEYQF